MSKAAPRGLWDGPSHRHGAQAYFPAEPTVTEEVVLVPDKPG